MCLSVTRVKIKTTLGIFKIFPNIAFYIVNQTHEEESDAFTCGQTHTSDVDPEKDQNQIIQKN